MSQSRAIFLVFIPWGQTAHNAPRRALSLPENHTFGICAPLLQLCKEIAIVSLCELGGSGYVDRYVCRDDCLA